MKIFLDTKQNKSTYKLNLNSVSNNIKNKENQQKKLQKFQNKKKLMFLSQTNKYKQKLLSSSKNLNSIILFFPSFFILSFEIKTFKQSISKKTK